MSTLGSLLGGLVRLIGVLGLCAVFLRLFFVDIVVVPHNGMAPTMTFGERVLVWRRAHVDMGDVVICEHPAKPGASVIGRAVAFAGHVVSTDGRGNLLVDDDRSSIEWANEIRFFDATREKLFTMRTGSIDYRRQNRHEFMMERDADFYLPAYQVNRGAYLLGDNRSDTIDDSRDFGEVDPDKCQGQVFMRLTPAPQYDDDVHHSYFDVIQ
jgi:signal peptidase I